MFNESDHAPLLNDYRQRANGSLIFAGYVCCLVALFFFPPGFAFAAFVIGIVVLGKGSIGHGVTLIVLAVACGIAGFGIGAYLWNHPLASLGSSLSNGSEAPQRAFSVTYGNKTYEGAIASNVGVAILDVQAGAFSLGYEFEIQRPDGKFIGVVVAINNRQHDAITMTPSLFEILDSSGNVYAASEKSIEIGSSRNLFLAQLNPGITKAGEVVFDVPETLGINNLSLRFRGGMTGESAELPLRVSATTQRSQVQEQPNAEEAPQPAITNGYTASVVPVKPLIVRNGVYRAGENGVSNPTLVYSVDAVYSDEANRDRIQGIVKVDYIVGVDGLPTSIHVSESIGHGLDENAVEAVKQYRFKPAMLNGEPVPVRAETHVKFQLY